MTLQKLVGGKKTQKDKPQENPVSQLGTLHSWSYTFPNDLPDEVPDL